MIEWDDQCDLNVFTMYPVGIWALVPSVYENMSRKRIHHKTSKRKDVPPDKDTLMGVDGTDGINDDEGKGEGKDEAPMAATSTSGAAILAGDALNEEDNDSEGDEGDEYLPDSDSYSSGISNHWGQGVVYRAGTLQIHCKDMDKVPTIYQPGHWKYIHNFPS